MTVIDFRFETERRERYIIGLADALREMFANIDPEEPESIQAAIVEVVAKQKIMTPKDLDISYRIAVARFAAVPPDTIDLRIDPASHHRPCLEWSRQYLIRIEVDFGVRLLEQQGRVR